MNRIAKSAAVALAALLAAALPNAARAGDAFTITAPFTANAVSSCGDFTMSDGVVDSQSFSGSVTGSAGHVLSNGNIKVSGGTINGNATAGPGKTVTTTGSGKITGTKSSAASAYDCKPIDLAALAPTLQASNDNATIPLTGQKKNPLGGTSHTDFSMSGGDTLTLAAGTYYFTKFSISGGSSITITGPVRIFCTGSITISGGSFVNTNPYRLRLWGSSTSTFTISGGSTLVGFVYTPNGPASISAARIVGSVFASAVTISGSSHVSRNIDDVLPQIAITAPANNSVVSDPAHVNVTGTVSDDTAVTVQVNGQPATIAADGTWQVTLNISGQTSPVTITATATDAAGNIAPTSVKVVTVPPPVLSLTLPPPDSWVSTSLVNLTGGSGTATSVTVNGVPASVANGTWTVQNFDLGTAEGAHSLQITGTNAGGPNSITKNLYLDLTAPTITASITPTPNAAGWNNTAPVTVHFTCSDKAGGSGIDVCPNDVVISEDVTGRVVSGTATDKAGNSAGAQVAVNLDRVNPAFTITSPADGQIVTGSHVTVTGTADDAVNVRVNGVTAALDANAHTFSAAVDLAEGQNTVTVTGTDAAGNPGSASSTVNVDTHAPQIAITAPASGACLNTAALDVTGNVTDPSLKDVSVQLGATVVPATPDAKGNWTASFSGLAEGKQLFTVTATDNAGHSATASLSVTIDRTAPTVALYEGGAPLTATLFNRAVTLFARAGDADPTAAVTLKVDGAAYTAGTPLSAEKAYTVVATATDCAGNQHPVTASFTIDLTPPALSGFDPAQGTPAGTMPSSISGTASEPATVSIAGTSISAQTDGANRFALAGVPFVNGANRFTLHAVDKAGNASDTAYSVTVRAEGPVVSITDNGAAIAGGALFNRAVTPVVSVNPSDVHPTATLTVGTTTSPFTSGTTLTDDGSYKIDAAATDPAGHTASASVSFTIDRTPPAVKITSPADGATIDADRVTVSGTAGDALAVTVNGAPATLSGGNFSATVALEAGTTGITATGTDAAGNRGSDQVSVSRAGTGSGVILTYPLDGLPVTNHRTTTVTGRVLTPADVQSLTLEGHNATGETTGVTTVVADPAGAFTVTAFPLFQGVDTITATTTAKNGKTASAVVHVSVDRTPPVLQILAGGVALDDGAHLPAATTLTTTASDPLIAGIPNEAPTVVLQVDGVAAGSSVSVADGAHTAIATATDKAGNQTRLVRAFTIGATQGTADCALSGFDPADGAIVATSHTTLVGKSGGAAGVKINGVPAQVANGMFSGTVELSVEGANSVQIVCTDANGNATGTPKNIVLTRVTAAPSVTIDVPEEMKVVGSDTIAVSGTVQNATSVDVNGSAATISNGTWSVPAVRLMTGLNILVAHAKNAAGAVAIATRRVVYLAKAPSLSVTFPTDGFSTGAATIDVSGTWSNLDPTTLQSSPAAASAVPKPWSDTSGAFVLRGVPLTVGANAVTVTGRDALNRTATVTVNVTRVVGAPSIAIASPADNSYLPATASIAVSGSFNGDPDALKGAQIDVNGTPATADAVAKSYSGTAAFSAGAVTPIVAHLQQPDGNAAIATVLVTQLGTAPAVKDVFPVSDAADAGVVAIVSFTAPMDGNTLRNGGFALLDASGAAVSGQLRVDRDVLTFAPATALTPGGLYTIAVHTSAKDLAGNALANEYSSKFTVATTAGLSAPTIDPIASPLCASTLTVSGTAPAGARVRVIYAGAPTEATANATGKYSVTLTIPAASSYATVSARVVGADGTLSPAFSTAFQIDCAGPVVLGATYDRNANAIAVTFSKPIALASVTVGASGSVQLALADGTPLSASVAAGGSSSVVVLTPAAPSGAPDPRTSTVNLTVTTAVKDTTGRNLAGTFQQTFSPTSQTPGAGDGYGYINGQIVDAANGRPLSGVSVAIAGASFSTDANGRYNFVSLAEGAYTIRVSKDGYVSATRQVVVPAGQGVVPIDVRLAHRGASATVAGADLTLSHGGDDTITRSVALTIPSGSAASGTAVTLTSLGAQSLPGLLPLGWSPLAAAELRVVTPAAAPAGAPTARLLFQLAASVAASGRSVGAVVYDAARDQWTVVQPVVSVGSDGKAQVNVALPATAADAGGVNAGTTAIALVVGDAAPLAAPPAPVDGGVLVGVADPCATTPCPAFKPSSFLLNPDTVLPTQATVATLVIDTADPLALFPSGTAIDAMVNEELHLTDGTVTTDQPFSTDLLLYRSLDGKSMSADFHLAPSVDAGKKSLQVGFDHIQIVPYPGRLDRGALVGSAGGRVASDEQVQIDIPAGATADPLHATARSMAASDFAQFGTIDGFQIVAGVTLTLDKTASTAQPFSGVQLVKSATATFTVDPQVVGAAPQLILAEVLPSTAFGRMFRLANRMAAPQPIDSSALQHVSTAAIDASKLPVDGIVRPGQYLLLLARQPIAFATGVVQMNGVPVAGAAVVSSSLGVRDLTRTTGIYNVPVVAKPAAPFVLTPLHPTQGDGVAYTAPASPDPNDVVNVPLTFTLQPPTLQSVTVTGTGGGVDLVTQNGAGGIVLSSGVQAVFSQSLDKTSVGTGSITVVDSNGQRVSGTTTSDGSPALTWTLDQNVSLSVNATYTVTIQGSVRGSHGAPLGATRVFTFSTVTQLVNSSVHPEKIRITIPDGNGVSTVSGDAGALGTVPPEAANWRAIALRRGKSFATQYQVTAANDGSFRLVIGNCGGTTRCADAVSLRDHIDLEVLNAAGNIAAILPLTPFQTVDGLGFAAPADESVTFTSKDGVTVTAPAGAFDDTTIVTVHRIDNADPFANVPGFSQELEFFRGVELTFDCSGGTDPNAAPCDAHKRLDVSIPVDIADAAGKTFLLGKLGQSVLGPRIMIVDTLRLANGTLTTTTATSGQNKLSAAATAARPLQPGVQTTILDTDAKKYLMGVLRSGVYSAVDIRVPVGNGLGWAAIDGQGNNVDIFDSIFASLYLSHEYLLEGRGRVIMPVLTGKAFQLVGYDAGTGIKAFVKAYDPLPVADPGATFIIPPPLGDGEGPYPVFTSPGRVEVVDVNAEKDPAQTTQIVITRPNLTIELQGGYIKVTDTLPDDVKLFVLNVTGGHFAVPNNHVATLKGTVGDRLVIIEGGTDVDPETALSVVFSRRIDTGTSSNADDIDAFLHNVVAVWKAAPPPTPPPGQQPPPLQFFDVTKEARFEVDSSGVRLRILFPASLERGATYRVELKESLSEPQNPSSTTAPLKIGQARHNGTLTGDLQGSGSSVSLEFRVRGVAQLGSFSLPVWPAPAGGGTANPTGSVRDYALNGNILLVSALDGGLLAYDSSDPAALKDPVSPTAPKPMPFAYSPVLAGSQLWAVASDQHGRVYTTSLGNTFGALQSYRLEDFTNVANTTNPGKVDPRAQGAICWVPGSSIGLDIDTVISDRPEGIPRKLQLAEQDTTIPYNTLADFLAHPPSGFAINQTPNGAFTVMQVQVKKESSFPYVSQRITIENATRDMRWSADVPDAGATIHDVVAKDGDILNVIYNERTYGIVTLFGYGFGVFDLNAIDSNDDPNRPSNYKPISERVKITRANTNPDCTPIDDPSAIQDLTLSPEVALVAPPVTAGAPDPTLVVYGAEVHKGVLDQTLHPSTSSTVAPDVCDDRAPRGLILTPAASNWIAALNTAFHNLAGRDAWRRFNGIQTYYWHLEGADNKPVVAPSAANPVPWGQRHSTAGKPVDRTYLLLPGYEYGLIVLDTTFPGGALQSNSNPLSSSIADIIWVPAGAVSVRVIPKSHYAVVLDGNGRVLLVDLSHIDERWDKNGNPITAPLFSSVTRALTETSPYGGYGGLDPRIVWISNDPLVSGTLAPVIDVETGIAYAGSINDTKTSVIAALDPPIRLMANLGNGTLEEIGGVVPLGVEPPANVLNTGATATSAANASLAAFRIQISLPGAVAEQVTNATAGKLQVAVESERVPGAPVEQTPELVSGQPFPRAHFRTVRPDDNKADARPVQNFTVDRDVPAGIPSLRYQKGFNHFLSPWVVAIADPRASKSYAWPSNPALKSPGCLACDRPALLVGKNEPEVFELWSGGRDFAIRPQLVVPSSGQTAKTIFDGTGYEYLAQAGRFVKRFPTVMGDTTRALDVVAAAEAPPVAGGAVIGSVYLHSGELQLSSVDLAAGGRAGWNVDLDRTFRSRTMLPSPFGLGWTSSWFRRLRLLPNGAVEYRDGSGETWLFNAPTATTKPAYVAPAGLLLRLVRTSDGWQMIDMKRRITTFDTLGRILTESDEFGSAGVTENGNTIRYLYDRAGRLAAVVDPVGRATTLTYWEYTDQGATDWKVGRVKTVKDWRDRAVDYDYDAYGRLKYAQLTAVANDDGVARPTIGYELPGSTPTSYNDAVELLPQFDSVSDPSFNGGVSGGSVITPKPRVRFTYGGSNTRGKLTGETWYDAPNNGAGSSVSVDYGTLKVTDALGHDRTYALTFSTPPADLNALRAQVQSMTDTVQTAGGAGQLPSSVAPGAASTSTTPRKYTYGYTPAKRLQSITLDGVSSTTFGYNPVPAADPGAAVNNVTVSPLFTPPPQVPSAGASVNVTYQYQSGDSLFVDSIKTVDGTLQTPEPHRDFATSTVTNDTSETVTFDEKTGLLADSHTDSGTDAAAGNHSHAHIDRYDVNDTNLWRRSRPRLATNGDGGDSVQTSYDYDWTQRTMTVTDVARGVTTKTKVDEWDRPVDVTTTGSGLTLHETYTYFASGQVHKATRQQGTTTVTTTYTYDILGRLRDVTTDNVKVDGSPTSLERKIDYSVPATTVTTSLLPSGPTTTEQLDSLGRPLSSKTTTGTASTIDRTYGYDAAGNTIYTSGNFTASAMAYDAAGRVAGVRRSDGTYTTFVRDAWGNVKEVHQYDATGSEVGTSSASYTPSGRVKDSTVDTGGIAGSRTTKFAWDGSGSTSSAVVEGASSANLPSTLGVKRAARTLYDTAGRSTTSSFGPGDLGQDINQPFAKTTVSSYVGMLPTNASTQELNASAAIAQSFGYNTAGDATTVTVGGLTWQQGFDEAGNLTSSQVPARTNPTQYEYDARGSVTKKIQPDNKEIGYEYSAAGLASKYTDEAHQATVVTNTDRDQLGRPIRRVFADGTTEQFVWVGPRLQQYTNRAGQTQAFDYYPLTDRLHTITTLGPTGNVTLDSIDYDPAGRVQTWSTPGAILEYSGYDKEGHPATTKVTRLNPDGTRIATYVQTHQWNAHGERMSWSMPRAGALPNAWTDTVFEDHDEAGNVAGIRRSLFGAPAGTLLSAQYRNAGRPSQRTITTACSGLSVCTPATIVRSYDYNTDGQMNLMSVQSVGQVVAGSLLQFDGVQIADIQLLGMSGGQHHSRFAYDDRSRLVGAIPDTTDPGADPTAAGVPGRIGYSYSEADFANARQRTPRFDAATRASMQAQGIDVDKFDPPSSSVVEVPNGAHKIVSVTAGTTTRAYAYAGANVADDGKFLYSWDAKDELISVIQKPTTTASPIRRIRYFYDGNGRVVGRRAETAMPITLTGPFDSLSWQLENNPGILAADGLPADTTFVWDPVSDQLVSVFDASVSPADPSGGLLKQFVHGGLGYDDPIEVTLAAGNGAVQRLYPVFDEPGSGSLQAILNAAGQVVSRNVPGDPDGADDVDIAGAAIDRVTIGASKDAAGALQTVTITVHATEPLDASTLSSGLRVSVLDANNAPVRSLNAIAQPVSGDAYSARFTVTAADWNALIAPNAASLSIGVTTSLRTQTWVGGLPILPPTSGQGGVFTGATYPFELRDSVATIKTWITGLAASTQTSLTIYDAPAAAIAGSASDATNPAAAMMTAKFQALPFVDHATGLIYARARWYSPATGMFLSADPMGYEDSSNLYAFAAGDSVNQQDPTGTVASVSMRHVIVGTRPDGTHYRIDPGTDPVLALRMLESDPDIRTGAEQEDILMRAGFEVPFSSECRAGESCISSGRPNLRAYHHYRHDGHWVRNGIAALSGLPPQNHEQMMVQGTVQIVSTVASAAVVVKGGTNARTWADNKPEGWQPLTYQTVPRVTIAGAQGRAADIRRDNKVRPDRANVLVVDGEIDGMPVYREALSGRRTVEGLAPLPKDGERVLGVYKVGPRFNDTDTEVKILEELSHHLTRKSEGKIVFYSERDICAACQQSIADFSSLHPNIVIEYHIIGVQNH